MKSKNKKIHIEELNKNGVVEEYIIPCGEGHAHPQKQK